MGPRLWDVKSSYPVTCFVWCDPDNGYNSTMRGTLPTHAITELVYAIVYKYIYYSLMHSTYKYNISLSLLRFRFSHSGEVRLKWSHVLYYTSQCYYRSGISCFWGGERKTWRKRCWGRSRLRSVAEWYRNGQTGGFYHIPVIVIQ